MMTITGLRQAIIAGLAMVLGALASGPAMAQTASVGNPSAPPMPDTTFNGSEYGQSFVVPAGVTRIVRAGLVIHANRTTVLAIKQGVGSGYAPLGASTSITGQVAPTTDSILREMAIPTGGISVTPGQTYFITSSQGAVALTNDYYAAGELSPIHVGKDAYFVIEFDNVTPVAVPTLSEWSLILLGLTMVGGSMVLLTRRRRQA